VLRSGERCIYDVHETGNHLARIYVPTGIGRQYQQSYAWVDPQCGVHSAGFFPK